MANPIQLTESQLRSMISEAVQEAMKQDLDEAFWKQLGTSIDSFFGNGYGKDKEGNYRNTVDDRQRRGENTANWLNKTTPMNLKGRWNAAKTGWKEQGRIDNNTETVKVLNTLAQKYGADKTLGQILKSLDMGIKGANGRISKANNDIYRGTSTGVMGSGKYQTV